jgi:ABC-2 type transport system ATP-binding protein
VLQLSSVYKRFNENEVLIDLSLSISPGEIVGFIGANGSGKTTTMRAILGLLEIDAGEIVIDGQNRSKISKPTPLLGYMPEERGLYQKQGVRSQLQYFAELQGMNRKIAGIRVKSLLERMQLNKHDHKLLGDLSLGNQQRAQLIAALIHNPRYLVLDEPFSGLDPTGLESILSVLNEESSNGVGILFSSHVLPHVQEISDRILILNHGRTYTYKNSFGSLSDYYHSLESDYET